MEATIGKILISQQQIEQRVAELAGQINRHYSPGELILVAIMNGSLIFLADLVRLLNLPVKFDFIGISSYTGTESTGTVSTTKNLKIQVSGHRVLLIDDILDTGQTLHNVRQMLTQQGVAEVKICVLLDKPARRRIPIQADFYGFTIPDEFVVGYGLDYQEKYRNLPYIATLKFKPSPPAAG